MTASTPAADPIRDAIIAAMDRLSDGTPLRSSGRLSVSQLAIEAGVKRWHLTHQHLDLKELFQARVQAAASTPKAFAHAKLIAHCAELEERLKSYATAISLLTLENAALAASRADASVVPLPRPETSP
ncbi:hypothetical protein K4749_33435 [Streptomyces sp. TRM72054]|uniref:hypothetical protein n=1 Tax=Streptomyces sp. TRM72054 TaxID=2870562 RepID=UPI001C8B8E6F|nr:hypothetical protein [Streptomyces sp. TRM72054]MBX9398362.1 hypothetical protein [Streptomyces sp. TRM72054]